MIVDMSTDISGLMDALEGIPNRLIKTGMVKAAEYAMQPTISAVKMSIAKELAGNMDSQGVTNYQNSIILKRKSKAKYVWVGVGADVNARFYSEHTGRFDQNWARLGHIFEGGTVTGIIGKHPIREANESESHAIVERYKNSIVSEISQAVNAAKSKDYGKQFRAIRRGNREQRKEIRKRYGSQIRAAKPQ